jgi:hypothetical protein
LAASNREEAMKRIAIVLLLPAFGTAATAKAPPRGGPN